VVGKLPSVQRPLVQSSTPKNQQKLKVYNLGEMVPTCGPSTQEAEEGQSLSSGDQGQPGECSKILSQK
jgi:hypothetical protein